MFLMYYAHVRPETGGLQLYTMESFNQFAMLTAAYNLMFYTYFIGEPMTRYLLGYSFVLNIAALLSLNVLKMLYNMVYKYRVQIKKGMVQRAYERRFKEYAAVERLRYMIRFEKIT
jgi:hypothetical protein